MKFLFTTLILMVVIPSLHAQTAPDVLSKQETESLILNYCSVLKQTYFNTSLGEEIVVTLKKKLKTGEFDNVNHLTDHLSRLLRNITKDNHFYIGVNRPVDVAKEAQTMEANVVNKNGGFSELKIIDNNIGYIKWTEFIANNESFEKLTAALQFLKGCKYLIFDLSSCPGGRICEPSFV